MIDPVLFQISIIKGDITEQQVDVIVNAANPSLSGGGGVDGAIHRAAGPELDVECRMLGGCATGDVMMTKGYRLPARYVIHTVGPVWKGGNQNEEVFLASCYRKSLEHADSHKLQTIAFPAISTGAYGFPLDRATRIAVATVIQYLRYSKSRLQVRFVCHSDQACRMYDAVLKDPAILNTRQGREVKVRSGGEISSKDTPGEIREQVAGQLGIVETVYGIRIVNHDFVLDEIVKHVRSRDEASFITAGINSWVATKGFSGRMEIPPYLIASLLNKISGRKGSQRSL